MLVVPGHCLAQVSREFLQLYATARILVADETNFVEAERSRFLARAATANWDAVIITHAAFRFIPVPSAFEQATPPITRHQKALPLRRDPRRLLRAFGLRRFRGRAAQLIIHARGADTARAACAARGGLLRADGCGHLAAWRMTVVVARRNSADQVEQPRAGG